MSGPDEPSSREQPTVAEEAGRAAPGDDAGAGRTPAQTASGRPGGGADGEQDAPRSGLRNPAGALRGVGAACLAIEALVLLLAIQPLRVLGGNLAGWGVWSMVGLAVLCCVLAGLLRRRWAWYAGVVVQVLVIGAGVAQWAIAVLGVIFAGIWLYVLHLRRSILGRV